MSKIQVVKKNSDYTSEYEVGDVFEITGKWYGGVHVVGRYGAPVSLDRDEYVELEMSGGKTGAEPVTQAISGGEPEGESDSRRDICVGDIVRHFKREWVSDDTSEYLYKVLAFASHTETEEKLVVYQAMYAPFKICARPYDMFMSEVDREKYPDVRQKYRFEKEQV